MRLRPLYKEEVGKLGPWFGFLDMEASREVVWSLTFQVRANMKDI